MTYSYCGNSGLQLPKISLGLWHNFGSADCFETAQDIVKCAFDNGVTHFDLANNYGPPPGSAEENFGKMLKTILATHRDEIVISTKAGHQMWQGAYGDGGSRKHLMASINQSLQRMGIEYVDIFYSHRYDPNTPVEETMQALADIVKQGKALYIGISKYPVEVAKKAYELLAQSGVHCLVHQDKYSMLAREVEQGILDAADRNGVGFTVFSPLAQGLLTDRYLQGIPENSRAATLRQAQGYAFLKPEQVSAVVAKVEQLNSIAQKRNQTLAQAAIAWVLKDKRVTSAIVGASSVVQLKDSLKALDNPSFSTEELNAIEKILSEK
jgi:L-glyceraldehyde 3-phosphate reductase